VWLRWPTADDDQDSVDHTPQPIRIFAVDVNVLPPEYSVTKKIVSISSAVVHDIIRRRSHTDVFRDFFTVIVIALCECVFTAYNIMMPTLQFFVPRPPRGEIVAYNIVRLLLLLFFIPVCNNDVRVFFTRGGRYGPFLVAVTCIIIITYYDTHLRPTAWKFAVFVHGFLARKMLFIHEIDSFGRKRQRQQQQQCIIKHYDAIIIIVTPTVWRIIIIIRRYTCMRPTPLSENNILFTNKCKLYSTLIQRRYLYRYRYHRYAPNPKRLQTF